MRRRTTRIGPLSQYTEEGWGTLLTQKTKNTDVSFKMVLKYGTM